MYRKEENSLTITHNKEEIEIEEVSSQVTGEPCENIEVESTLKLILDFWIL